MSLQILMGAAPSRTYTYSTGAVIDPGQVTTNEDNIYTYIQGGVDTYASASIGAAAIADNAVGASEIASGSVDVVDLAGTAADDRAFVADSSTAGTWRAIPNCTDASGNHLNYTAGTNSFSCGTTSSASGDVTEVGPGCATGACLTDGLTTTGTTLLIWEGTTDDANEFIITVPSNPTADVTFNVTEQIIKGWAQFDANTGTPILRDSFNVTSITDNGVGDYSVVWSTAMADGNYACIGAADATGDLDIGNIATTECRVNTRDAAEALADSADVCVAAIGDQ